jgi:hypothetical protein
MNPGYMEMPRGLVGNTGIETHIMLPFMWLWRAILEFRPKFHDPEMTLITIIGGI